MQRLCRRIGKGYGTEESSTVGKTMEDSSFDFTHARSPRVHAIPEPPWSSARWSKWVALRE